MCTKSHFLEPSEADNSRQFLCSDIPRSATPMSSVPQKSFPSVWSHGHTHKCILLPHTHSLQLLSQLVSLQSGKLLLIGGG